MASTIRPNPPVDPVTEAYKSGVDRSLLRQNLQLSVEQRFDKMIGLQRFAAELRRAGRQARQRQ